MGGAQLRGGERAGQGGGGWKGVRRGGGRQYCHPQPGYSLPFSDECKYLPSWKLQVHSLLLYQGFDQYSSISSDILLLDFDFKLHG